MFFWSYFYLPFGNDETMKQPKFRNAEQAHMARENKESWDRKVKEWKSMSRAVGSVASGKLKSPVVSGTYVDPLRSTKHIPSLVSSGHVSTARTRNVYTGDKIIGIATMHKSNAVPVFAADTAAEISRMRRG